MSPNTALIFDLMMILSRLLLSFKKSLARLKDHPDIAPIVMLAIGMGLHQMMCLRIVLGQPSLTR